MNDFYALYQLLEQEQKSINALFDTLGSKDSREVEDFLLYCGLQNDQNELYLGALTRIVSLRSDTLVEALKQQSFDDVQIKDIKTKAYAWVSRYYLLRYEALIEKIEKSDILSPFNLALLHGVHNIGKVISNWQIEWTAHIIDGINSELEKLGDPFAFLQEKKLIDTNPDGTFSDRCYSVLERTENGYVSKAYGDFFQNFTDEISQHIDILIDQLQELEDDSKESYINYFTHLQGAFCEKDVSQLIHRWQDVERAWMDVKSPLQVGHPLEYYEDHYRKSVALEWDIRFQNPNAPKVDDILQSIKSMFGTVFASLGFEDRSIYEKSLQNLDKVQLYIGRPFVYYGAEFDGLFSAQVVPNDESVSLERGKKIFAFADNVLQSARSRPFLKFHTTIFGKEFLDFTREVLFKNETLWHRLYHISTIGHEFGHILWCDEQSESVMNRSGNFKNIEEFKATTGGLMAYFYSNNESEWKHLLADLIKRAVGLISWKEVAEVEAYYCEGLIHLCGLFEVGVLKFENTLEICMDYELYQKLVEWYKKTYADLAKSYLQKEDASEFLYRFVQKDGKYFMPKSETLSYFVQYYTNLYKTQGRVIDDESKKEDWI